MKAEEPLFQTCLQDFLVQNRHQNGRGEASDELCCSKSGPFVSLQRVCIIRRPVLRLSSAENSSGFITATYSRRGPECWDGGREAGEIDPYCFGLGPKIALKDSGEEGKNGFLVKGR